MHLKEELQGRAGKTLSIWLFPGEGITEQWQEGGEHGAVCGVKIPIHILNMKLTVLQINNVFSNFVNLFDSVSLQDERE